MSRSVFTRDIRGSIGDSCGTLRSLIRLSHPAGVVRGHTDVGIIRPRIRGGDQDQPCSTAGCRVSQFNQSPTDALFLKRCVDRQVGQISAVREVGDRAADSDE